MYRKDKIRIIAGAFGLAGFFVLTWIVTSGYAAGFWTMLCGDFSTGSGAML